MIESHREGWVFRVRAQPGAKRPGVLGFHGSELKLAVTAPADRGRANEAIITLLAECLGCKRSQIELLSGQTNRSKRFLIRGLTRAELETALQSLAGSASCGPLKQK